MVGFLSVREKALAFHLLDELGDGLVGDTILLDVVDERRPDDGTIGVGAGVVETGLVLNAEANHPLIAQPEGSDAVEISATVVDTGLDVAGYASGSDHIDEAVGIGIDLSDAVVGRLRRDERDETDVALIEELAVVGEVLLPREVGEDETIDTTRLAIVEETLEAIVHHGIDVAHEDDRYGDGATHSVEL